MRGRIRNLVLGELNETGHRREDGYAAVDALMALSILATTLVLSIAALQTSRRMAETALEATAARTAATHLLTDARFPVGTTEGQDAQFRWSVSVVMLTDPSAAVSNCRKSAALRALKSGRRYEVETRDGCPDPAAKQQATVE